MMIELKDSVCKGSYNYLSKSVVQENGKVNCKSNISILAIYIYII